MNKILGLPILLVALLFPNLAFATFDEFQSISWNMQGAFSSVDWDDSDISSPPNSDWTNNVQQFFTQGNDIVALQEAGARPASAQTFAGSRTVTGTFQIGTIYPAGDSRNRFYTSVVTEYLWNGYYLYHLVVDGTRPGMRCNIAIVSVAQADHILLFPPSYEQNRAPDEVSGTVLPRLSTRPVLGISVESPVSEDNTVFWSLHAQSHPYNEVPRFLQAMDHYHDHRYSFDLTNYTESGNAMHTTAGGYRQEQSFAVLGDFNRNIGPSTDAAARTLLGVPSDLALIRTDQYTHFNLQTGANTELDMAVTGDFSDVPNRPSNQTNAVATLGGGAFSDHYSVSIYSPSSCNQRCTSDLNADVRENLVTLFQHSNYGGYGVDLEFGEYTLAELTSRGMIDNDISSIDIPVGYTVTVYGNDNFTGWQETYSSDVSWLGSRNDQVSSVIVRPAPALHEAVSSSTGANYQYGSQTQAPTIALDKAPADTDFERWATLQNGASKFVYFFKKNTNNIIYEFVYNSSTGKYEWGLNGTNQITISGMPSDADSTSFAMLYSGSFYHLYMRSKTSNVIYQAGLNTSTQQYEYGYSSLITSLDIKNGPSDTDYSRWAMLHDGTHYRFYAMKNGSNDTIYHFGYNPSSEDYEYGHLGITQQTITNMPSFKDTGNFAMAHGQGGYQFYFKSH